MRWTSQSRTTNRQSRRICPRSTLWRWRSNRRTDLLLHRRNRHPYDHRVPRSRCRLAGGQSNDDRLEGDRRNALSSHSGIVHVPGDFNVGHSTRSLLPYFASQRQDSADAERCFGADCGCWLRQRFCNQHVARQRLRPSDPDAVVLRNRFSISGTRIARLRNYRFGYLVRWLEHCVSPHQSETSRGRRSVRACGITLLSNEHDCVE